MRLLNDDIKYLLLDAEKLLKEIIENYTVLEKDIGFEKVAPTALKIKTKQFLENIRSSLDYFAYYLFDNYCKDGLSNKEANQILRRLYFPTTSDKRQFSNVIKDSYPNLSEQCPNIIDAIEKVQKYNYGNNESSWLNLLVKLSNSNKHRYLSLQEGKVFIKGKNVGLNDVHGMNFILNDNLKIKWPGFTIHEGGVTMGDEDIKNGLSLGSAIQNESRHLSGNPILTCEFMFSMTRTMVTWTLTLIWNGCNELFQEIFPEHTFTELNYSENKDEIMLDFD